MNEPRTESMVRGSLYCPRSHCGMRVKHPEGALIAAPLTPRLEGRGRRETHCEILSGAPLIRVQRVQPYLPSSGGLKGGGNDSPF